MAETMGSVTWPPPQTAENPSRCDFCPRRDVVVLDVACVHEHIGEVIVCREKHEPRTHEGEVACTDCADAGHWCELTVLGVSPKRPEPRPSVGVAS